MATVLAPAALIAGLSYGAWQVAEDMEREGARPRGRGAGMWPQQAQAAAAARKEAATTIVDPTVTALVAEAQRILSEAQAQVQITNNLVLDGEVIARTVNNVNSRDMARR